MIKISFIGDIMSYESQDIAIKKNNISYDEIFEPIKKMLNTSSLVVGNLETTVAGEDASYTNDAASFNTPEEILLAIRKCGIDMVTTANNHILDRGVKGMVKTIDNLDKYGIKHTGSYRTIDEAEHVHVEEMGGGKNSYTILYIRNKFRV
ncbi:MAG: CapA family protein [Prevotella sp.]|nr:CapA family protein [Prevotella sp.]